MRRSKSFFIRLAFVLITMILWSTNLVSSATTIYGPRKFIRSTGKPIVVTETFSAPNATTYNLIVFNGEKGKNRVSSGTVKINGIEILRESDFNQQVDRIERSVSLLLSNSISVELRSTPGSFITVSITSETENHPPVAQDQNITTDEDTSKAITLVATDPDGDTLTYMVVVQPSHGTLSGTLPNITYTPTAHFYGTDSFTFKANDGKLDSNIATVSITVNHVNHAPVAQNQNVTTDEDASKAITLAATDPDGDPLTYQIMAQPSHGTLSGTAPNVTYIPASRYFGSDGFTFKANDGKLDSNIATVSITINHVNHAPVAQNQNVTTDEDASKAITLVATDPDGDTLTYTIVAKPSHGTLTGTPPNVTYTPTAHYFGSDSFAFKVNDGKIDSNTATVSITVNHVNHAPVAQNQNVTTDEDTAKAVALAATDPDGDLLSYTIVTQPTHGTLSGTPPNVIYTPTAHYFGSDSFTFKANDGKVDSNIATVSIIINHVNHAPVAQNQNVTTDEDLQKAITLVAIDSDGDLLTYTIVAQPGHGTLTGVPPNVTYTPTAHYWGSDSFTFKANDGKVDSNIATVSITVNHVNHPPVAQDLNVTTDEDTSKAIALVATDPDNDPLAYIIVTQPTHGTLSGTPPNVIYTPTALYFGSDSFTFKANDGKIDSNTATVSITVNHVNHAPVAQNQNVTTDEDMSKAITLVAIDPDGDSLTYVIVAQPAHGALSGIPPNITYTPTAHFYGSDSFTFKANDGKVDSNIATVSIIINQINHAPIAQDQAITTSVDTAKVITLNATDVDGDPLTYQIMAQPSHGTLSGTAPNLTYTPAPQYSGSDSFTFKASDGRVDSNIATVSITVRTNHPPVAKNQCVMIEQDTAKPITLAATDADGDPLTYKIVDQPVHGMLSGTPPDVTYTPSSQYFGPDAFTYKANDGSADSNVSWVSIMVAPVVTRSRITTIAGNGMELYRGDGGLATNAVLYSPSAAAVDASGNLYVLEHDKNRIRKVDTKGVITTVAGDGTSGYEGDGGPATQAKLNGPEAIALDASGNLYIADTNNRRIRKVDRNGIITTVAGNGFGPTFRPDGGFWADDTAIPAIQASLGWPKGVAVDASGNLFIFEGMEVRKVDPNGIITSVVGIEDLPSVRGDNGASAIAVDALGNLFITGSDLGNDGNRHDRIWKVDNSGIITITEIGDTFREYFGMSITVDALGNLYVSGESVNLVIKVDTSGVISTVAGGGNPSDHLGDGGPATQAELDSPSGIAVDGFGNLYISDTGNARIRKVDANGIITTLAGGGRPVDRLGEGGPAIGAELDGVDYVTVDSLGNLYLSDWLNHSVRRIDSCGIITTVAGNGTAGWNGGGDGGPATKAALLYPEGIAVDAQGNLYIAEGYESNGRIRKVDRNGIITTVATGLYWPEGIAVDASGDLYIADSFNHRIKKMDANGNITTIAGSGPSGYEKGAFGGDNGPATAARLYYPSDVALDAFGNLYIADLRNNRIRKVGRDGIITTVAGNGTETIGVIYGGDGGPATEAMLNHDPHRIAVDASGNLYIADAGRIRKVDTEGIITTAVGNGYGGYSGDGGPPAAASLEPRGIAFDASGNLYISTYTERIPPPGATQIRKVVGLSIAASSIFGKVTDSSSGLPIWKNEFSPDMDSIYVTLTDSLNASYAIFPGMDGTFGITGLPAGVFTATFLARGYFPQTINGTLGPGEAQTHDVKLIPIPSLDLTIISPQHDAVVNSPTLVTGTVTNNANVKVNGVQALVNNGSFSVSILLDKGVNTIKAVATDQYGQSTYEMIYVILGGAIVGTVTDSLRGLALPSATVSVSDSRNPFQTATTDMNGNYTFSAIAPGFFYVSITKEGYTPYDFFGTIASGETVTVNAALSPIVPQIDNISIGEVTTHSATIFWSTDQPADSLVEYGITTSYGLAVADSTLTTNHSISLDNLTPGTTYHFRITSTNEYRFPSSSGDLSFATWAPGPKAYDRSVTMRMDTAKAITLLAMDPDDNPLTYTIVGQPIHGTLSGTLPYVTYAPAPHYVGSDSFTFKVNNGTMDSNVATVSVTVVVSPTTGNIITTVAGNGSDGYGGDGGPSTQAMLSIPWAVAADASGNLYIADSGNHRVRRIDTSGIITAIAGGGYGSDGGPAVEADLGYPSGVTMDSSGNLYIADSGSHRIRKVDSDGIITTIAGSGSEGYGGDNGPATEALLDNPMGVAVDAAGNLYIADMFNHRIRKVDPNGIITTVAGSGIPGSYIVDGTPATQAMLQYPEGVAVDTSGNLYIAAAGNDRILKVNSNGIITIAAGNGSTDYGGDGGPATEAMLNWPGGVVVDASGNVYIADSGNNLIRKVDANGIITTVAGTGDSGYSGDGGPAPLAMLNYPQGVALDAPGNLYVADCLNNRIRKVWGLSTPTTGSVAGKVTDSSTGIPLPNVSVTIKDFLNASYVTKTGSDGTYTVSGLAPGDFTATFALSGYIPQTVNGTSIVGQTQTLDIQLIPAPSLTIAISSPQDGATVHSSPVTVTGNVSNSASVTVNDVQASVTDNTFSVTIPLSEGSNAIQATATDQYGQTASQTIHVVLALVTGGSIAGTITDSLTSLPLASATVSVTDAKNLTQTALTDNSGGFTISGIGSGAFTGSITKGGYTARTFSGTMASGQTLTLNAALSPILPIITNIAVSGITMNSATITWTTDQLTDSFVEYGTTSSYGSWASDSTLTTTHTVILNNLIPGTTYHFRVTSKNGYGLPSSSEDNLFSTGGSIAGIITDSLTGLPLASATVSVTDAQNLTQTALTDNSGGFTISGIGSGPFTGSITKGGYTPRTFSGTMVSGQTLILNAALDPILPIITNIAVSGITKSSATITWTTDQLADSLVEYGTTTGYGSSAVDPTLTTSHRIVLLSLTPSTNYHFKVTSKNGYGVWSSSQDNSFATGSSNPITLVITAPSNNDTISRSDTLVRGTVSNWTGNETGVVVNGSIANVYGNQFVANHISLVEGSNIITATSTDTSGYTQTASVTVNAVTVGDYIRIMAIPESGISPLDTTFTIDSSLDLANATFNCTGPGPVEFSPPDANGTRATITVEGIYYCTASVNDTSGKLYNDTVAITVLSKIELDNLLRAKWEWMRANLASGDIERALVVFDEDAQVHYRELFNVLSTMLPTITQDMSDIQLIELMPNAAIYDIQTMRDGVTYSFQLLFTQDLNGLWRISSF
jgi:sugar lactone lactonase YvrE